MSIEEIAPPSDPSDPSGPDSSEPAPSTTDVARSGDRFEALAADLRSGEPFALIFGGQGANWLSSLSEIAAEGGPSLGLDGIVTAASSRLAPIASELAPLRPYGFEPLNWIEADATTAGSVPGAAALVGAAVSCPGALLAQIAVARVLEQGGLDLGRATAFAGHSQGVLGAAAVAEGGTRDIELVALAQILGAAGSLVGRRSGMSRDGRRSPMMAIGNVDPVRLQEIIDELNSTTDDPARARIAVRNGRRRVVVSGRPEHLDRLRRRCEQLAGEARAERESKRRGGNVFAPVFEEVDAEVGFHHPALDETIAVAVAWADACGIELDPATVSSVLPVGPGRPAEALARAVYTDPIDWPATVDAVRATGTRWLIDLGPGDLLTRMTNGVVRGAGIGVIPAGLREGRRQLFTPGAGPVVERPWADWTPRVVRLPNGTVSLDTAFTRLTGCSPVLLAGMTPTTVDPAIVAAAANGGHWAELAGGGQVTEGILADNLDRLADLLEPGRTVAFNALYLDPYLWKLQIGGRRLVLRARANGAPVTGVVVSAGIPELEDAISIAADLDEVGIEHLVFKPGTVAQLRQVVRIARELDPRPVIVHIEGGRAGGHHSWEDLDDLLLATYADLRARRNIVLCVGGGIGTPERGAEYLTGTWSTAFGAPPMPVDGILVGTAAMACLEATTSPQVKDLLVATGGSGEWIGAGSARNGMASGRSQLGADIHEIDNAAGRCGRLLDEVAGDAEAVAARRDEIVAALDTTAKPYFGDVEAMTYREWLLRYVELAVGETDEDDPSPWLDVTWRERFVAMLQRAEARLHPHDSGPVPTLFADPASTDRPRNAVAALTGHYPLASTTVLHPADVAFFVQLCRTPGKPVNFVPVVDAEVRRWWRSDSLWQAHDPRYPADAVVIIPGPVAVAGISHADEPVSELLDRFHAAAINAALDMAAGEAAGGRAGGEAADLSELVVEVARRRGDERFVAGPVGDALLSTTADWAGRCVVNPVHRLGAPETWSIDHDGNATHAGSGACLTSLDDDRVELVVPLGEQRRPLRAVIDASATTTNRSVRVSASEAVAAMGAMLEGVAGESGLPPVAGSHCAVVADWVDHLVADHTGVTTAGIDAPLELVDGVADALMVSCWPAVFAVLGSAVGADGTPVVEGLLDLVHLDHHVALPAGLPVSGPLEVSASVADVADTDVGRVVEVHVEVGSGEWSARMVERFAVRGRAGAAALDSPSEATVGRPMSQTQRVRRRDVTVDAPGDLSSFAHVSGDHNPIHTSTAAARLAGLGGPIVHGMWLSAMAQHLTSAGEGDEPPVRIEGWTARFLSPVRPGASIDVRVDRVGVCDGGEVREVVCRVDGEPVMVATASCRPPLTAYAFPGQGIQRIGMGLDSRDRSKAARAVWDRADAHTAAALGFSILTVVRDNPTSIVAAGIEHHHPDGVLFLTQFTQVAMATVAMAQVAELREAGVFVDDAICCGHSVGEYNALAAVTGVLPLEAVLEVVFRRGMAMHHLVPRDDAGRSNYRLAAIRPSEAGIADDDVTTVVAEVSALSGEFLQVVNYNLRGTQYAVAGTGPGLDALEAEMERRRAAHGGKRAFIVVPGIDVPFHSSVLRDGVEEFRGRLEELLPDAIDPELLVGRYIPNLVPRLFTLDRGFVEEIAELVPSDPLAAALSDWDAWEARPGELCRLLLVELLAWQFASPVRWIETQDLMFTPVHHGGLGVERFVEIGLASQPTISNLARSTVSHPGHLGPVPQIRNVESDRSAVFMIDSDPEESIDVDDAPAISTEEGETPTAPTAVAATAPVPAATQPVGSVADLPFGPADATDVVIALWTKLRPEQMSPIDTIESLCDGVSSRRNQLLVDLGGELDLGAIDGAADADLSDLRATVTRVARTYRPFGPVLRENVDDQLRRVLGPTGKRPAAIGERVTSVWGLGDGWVRHVTIEIVLGTRDGSSVRGGALGGLVDVVPAGTPGFEALVDAAVLAVAGRNGVAVSKASSTAGAGAMVDSAALDALLEGITGPDGVLAESARLVLGRLGHLDATETPVADRSADELSNLVSAELGAEWARMVAPAFDPARAVLFDDRWASARSDLADLWHAGPEEAEAISTSLRLVRDDVVAEQARWWERAARSDGLEELAGRYESIASEAASPVAPGRFADDVAVVTGASPGSIAAAVVAGLLEGGATVVATTSRLDAARVNHFARLYRSHATAGAALWVVPANLASFADVDSVASWIGSEQTVTTGATVAVVKAAMTPTLLFPFAAPAVSGDLAAAGPRAELEMRVLLWSVERLLGALSTIGRDRHLGSCLHVVLPGSPNRGRFGGDGAYGESKAALDAVVARWRAERSWAGRVSLVHAIIGWVRGTSLMAGNDPLVGAVEAAGVRTFSAVEMAGELLARCDVDTRAAAASAPLTVDLTGGLAEVELDLAGLASEASPDSQQAEGAGSEPASIGATTIDALPAPPGPGDAPWPAWSGEGPAWAPVGVRPEEMIVIVGTGEVGPYGSARTRFEVEVDGRLSSAGVAELAWVCGLVTWEADPVPGWYDSASGEAVAEHELAARYHDEVVSRCGIRTFSDDGPLVDASAPMLASVFLERDLTFPVSSESEARAFVDSDPDHTAAHLDEASGEWRVTRRAGTEIRVPRRQPLSRSVGAQIPDGFDVTRYGVPADLAASLDRMAAWNIAATVDAFVGSGFDPVELMGWVHPSEVANTQGTGIGGMQSVRAMYIDGLLGEPYANDVLQEALPNVVAAHVAQGYVGGYGAMVHPVAACATAAVSLEEGVDKIRLGRARLVVTGGFDDLSVEGIRGFGDMAATAETSVMAAKGIEPRRMSRANDRRRGGFVEGQGGGTVLLARGDLALAMGLPVLGVVAYAGSFGDGVHTSIPAPGLGALAAGRGGRASELATSLAALGVEPDEVRVVSKHDTSTLANDPNESELHERLASAIGRSPGAPLFVISQKSLTGHAKGGAAAFQLAGLCQVLASGMVPPNRSLDCVDPVLSSHPHLVWPRQPIRLAGAVRPKAALLTSLGFGHVSALVALVHPDAFLAALEPAERAEYASRATARQLVGRRRLLDAMCGGAPLYTRPPDRRVGRDEGDPGRGRRIEAAMLLDPSVRLGSDGVYAVPGDESEGR